MAASSSTSPTFGPPAVRPDAASCRPGPWAHHWTRQENISLAAGETRRLEGDFVLDVAALDPGRALEWIVVFSDAAGFAHQAMVRADPAPAVTLDADARAAAQSLP